jgi:hydrogenase small subunit
MVRSLRQITMGTVDKEPKWRHKGAELTTGYKVPSSYSSPK